MGRAGSPRREVLARLCPAGPAPIVDVGADHGLVAQEIGAVATELHPRRAGAAGVPWVVCDGLAAFRQVGVAVVAGMGALTIAGILERGPRPKVAVLHAADDPPRLRCWLAANGWRIDDEALAPEAGRFAEVIRAVPGVEPASGALLELGPRLMAGSDAHLGSHVRQLAGHYRRLVEATRTADPGRAALFRGRLAVLAEVDERIRRGGPSADPATGEQRVEPGRARLRRGSGTWPEEAG